MIKPRKRKTLNTKTIQLLLQLCVTSCFYSLIMDLGTFIRENKKSGGLSIEISNQVEKLWNEYKLEKTEENCSIISADFGRLGSLNIKEIASFEEEKVFKYESGSYDYISTKTKSTTNILWTDYQEIEPYNRQSGLYANGSSFESLGKPILEKEDYREFVAKHVYNGNVAFAVWGYGFNNFYESITFGICLKTDKVDEFISKLRVLIGK